jgi:hypothetical protein
MPDERTFDWRPPTDERRAGNIPFAMGARATTIQTGKPLRSHSWKRHLWLDQGQEGSCTGFGAAHTLGEGQYWRQLDNTAARSFYKGAQRYDEWPGENYEGSSVLGVMEYLHHETDYLREYWWATNLDEILHAICYYGPVEMGSWWRSGMMNTHDDGYIRNTGGVVGGHAYCLGQVDLVHRRVRVDQSWGRDWGWDGAAWLDFDDLAGLLADGGECALPRKTKAA